MASIEEAARASPVYWLGGGQKTAADLEMFVFMCSEDYYTLVDTKACDEQQKNKERRKLRRKDAKKGQS